VRTVQLPQLQLGSRGQNVQRLQRLLNSRLDSDTDLKVDGIFGPKTRASVIEFQKESDLKSDGIVGRETWFALISAPPQPGASKPKPAPRPVTDTGTGIATAGPGSAPEVVPKVSAPKTERGVDEWSLAERFEYVLIHTGAHLAPDLRAQFTALLTPTNIGIMVGSLVVWAAGHFCGVSELTDAFLLGFGLVFLGRAALDVARYLKNFIELTCSASTKAELEDAASDLAQAIAILGVVAFFSLLAKVSRAIGDKPETAKETAAPPEDDVPPPPKGKHGTVSDDTAPKAAGSKAKSAAESTADTAVASPVNQPVYRVDGRPPSTIFNEGFQPRGTSTDLKSYVDTNNPSAFVSTSKTPAIADNPDFAKPGAYLYEVDGAQVKGIDVNSAYPANPFAHESEIAVVGGVPTEAIISAKPILPGGGLGPAIPNPAYNGGL
jgi:hypothetical protein